MWSLGADPSLSGASAKVPEGDIRLRDTEIKSPGDPRLWSWKRKCVKSPDLIQGPAPSTAAAAEAARLPASDAALHWTCPPEAFATAGPGLKTHYSGLSPGTRLLSNPVLFLTLSYSGLYPESYSPSQKILNFHLIFSICLCVIESDHSLGKDGLFVSFTTKTTPLKKKNPCWLVMFLASTTDIL